MSLHVEAPFVKNFQFFYFGFFPTPKMDRDDAGNHNASTPTRKLQELARNAEVGVVLRTFSESAFHVVDVAPAGN